jgi:hypothetical protein
MKVFDQRGPVDVLARLGDTSRLLLRFTSDGYNYLRQLLQRLPGSSRILLLLFTTDSLVSSPVPLARYMRACVLF